MTKCNEQTALLDSIELLYLDGEQIVLKGSVRSAVTGFMNNWKIAKADYLGQGRAFGMQSPAWVRNRRLPQNDPHNLNPKGQNQSTALLRFKYR